MQGRCEDLLINFSLHEYTIKIITNIIIESGPRYDHYFLGESNMKVCEISLSPMRP